MPNPSRESRFVLINPRKAWDASADLVRDLFQTILERLDNLDVRGDGFAVPDGSVSTAKLQNGAVTTAKLAANAVDSARLQDGAVGVSKLASDAGALLQGAPSFSVGSESGNAIAVAVQLVDAKGANVAAKTVCQVWLSDAAGGARTATAPSGAVTVGVGAVLVAEYTAKTHGVIVTDSAGAFTLTVNEAGAKTWYLNLETGGRLYTSGPITFV